MAVADAYKSNFLGTWGKIATIQKPIIGAVAGYAVSLVERAPVLQADRVLFPDAHVCNLHTMHL